MQAASAKEWLANHALALDCAQHARMFFGSADFGLDSAIPGRFTLTPTPEMQSALARDYAAMSGMVFGKMVELDTVLGSVERLEQAINNSSIGKP